MVNTGSQTPPSQLRDTGLATELGYSFGNSGGFSPIPHDETSNRSMGVSYRNTTGKPMIVFVNISYSLSTAFHAYEQDVCVDSIPIDINNENGLQQENSKGIATQVPSNAEIGTYTISFVVPDQYYYAVIDFSDAISVSIIFWVENY